MAEEYDTPQFKQLVDAVLDVDSTKKSFRGRVRIDDRPELDGTLYLDGVLYEVVLQPHEEEVDHAEPA